MPEDGDEVTVTWRKNRRAGEILTTLHSHIEIPHRSENT
jgi:hypothetical protein